MAYVQKQMKPKEFSSFFSIKNVLIISYFLLSVFILSTLSVAVVNITSKVIREKQGIAVLNSFDYIDDKISGSIHKYSEKLISLIYDNRVQKLLRNVEDIDAQDRVTDTSYIFKQLNNMNINVSEISFIYLIDNIDNIYSVNNGNYAVNREISEFRAKAWYAEALKLNGALVIDLSGKTLHDDDDVIFIQSITNLEGNKSIGLAVLGVKKRAFASLLQATDNFKNISIIDKNNNYAIYNGDIPSNTKQIFDEPLFKDKNRGFFERRIDGNRNLVVFLRNNKCGYTLISQIPYSYIFKDADKIKNVVEYLVIFLILIVLMLSYFLSRFLVKPVNKLLNLMDRVEKGDMNVQVPNMPENEMGLLADKFNSMVIKLRNSLPLRREKFINKLLCGKLSESDYIKNHQELGINLSETQNRAVIVEICRMAAEMNVLAIEEFSNYVYEKLLKYFDEGKVILHEYDSRRLVLIISSADNEEVDQRISSLKSLLENELGINVTFGVGRAYKGLTEIYKSYNEAQEALKYKFFVGENEVIYLDDIQNMEYDMSEYPSRIEEEIASLVKIGHHQRLEDSVDVLFLFFKKHYVNKDFINYVMTSIYLRCMEVMNNCGVELFSHETERFESIEELKDIDNIDVLKERFLAVLNGFVDRIQEKREDKTNDAIKKAVDYINSNYQDSDLCVGIIAKELFLSENYFSKLFKKETGEKFSNYLSRIRLEKAQQLLMTTDLKVYEVAAMVGYNDPNYFSSAYKGYFNITPAETKHGTD